MRAVGLGTALAVALLALAGGAGGVALAVIFATFGFYAVKPVARAFPRRLWLKRIGYLVGTVCVALILLRALSLLPDLALRGYGLWGPLLTLLLAFTASILLEREKVAEADKFRVILALHPRADGSEWSAKQMEARTDGEVSIEFFERLQNRKTASSPWLG